MDRTLNHSLIALCAAGLVLALGLLAASPADRRSADPLPAAATTGDEDGAEGDLHPRGSAKGARRGLALPYFSFAHGLRRIGG